MRAVSWRASSSAISRSCLGRPRVHGTLDVGAQDGERRLELVAGVGRESAQRRERGLEPGQHRVQRGRQAPSSSFSMSGGRRRWRLRPSVIASTSLMRSSHRLEDADQPCSRPRRCTPAGREGIMTIIVPVSSWPERSTAWSGRPTMTRLMFGASSGPADRRARWPGRSNSWSSSADDRDERQSRSVGSRRDV